MTWDLCLNTNFFNKLPIPIMNQVNFICIQSVPIPVNWHNHLLLYRNNVDHKSNFSCTLFIEDLRSPCAKKIIHNSICVFNLFESSPMYITEGVLSSCTCDSVSDLIKKVFKLGRKESEDAFWKKSRKWKSALLVTANWTKLQQRSLKLETWFTRRKISIVFGHLEEPKRETL